MSEFQLETESIAVCEMCTAETTTMETTTFVDGAPYTICAECWEIVVADFASLSTCQGCDDAIETLDTGTPVSGAFEIVRGSVVLRIAEQSQFDGWCESCSEDFVSCEMCGYVDSSGYDHSYCETCEACICEGCSYYCDDCGESTCRTHQHEHDYDDYEYADDEIGTLSIQDALRREFVRGDVIWSRRAFGVEIETDGGSVRDAIADFRTDVVGGYHGEHCGWEIVSLPMRGQFGERGIRHMISVLHSAGFRPNGDCGGHFHLDMSAESASAVLRIGAALRIVEPLMYAFADSRRLTSNWCRETRGIYRWTVADMLEASEAETEFDVYDVQPDRYCGVNLHAYSAHGTIEIRILDGTEDVERITHAIAFAAAVADYAVILQPSTVAQYIGRPVSLALDVFRNGGISAGTLAYVLDRFAEIPVPSYSGNWPGFDDGQDKQKPHSASIALSTVVRDFLVAYATDNGIRSEMLAGTFHDVERIARRALGNAATDIRQHEISTGDALVCGLCLSVVSDSYCFTCGRSVPVLRESQVSRDAFASESATYGP